MKNILISTILSVILFASSASLAQSDGIIISKMTIGDACSPNIGEVPTLEGGGEALDATLLALTATSLVEAGVSLLADWFKDYEDSLKGSDSASGLGSFYCTNVSGTRPQTDYGIRTALTYERYLVTPLEFSRNGDRRVDRAGKVLGGEKQLLMRVVASIEYLTTGNGKNGQEGVFTIKPNELTYNSAIAQRGDTKDLTLTYSFEFLKDDGTTETKSLEPYVIEALEEGAIYPNLADLIVPSDTLSLPGVVPIEYASSFFFPTSDKNTDVAGRMWTPFKVTLQLAETSVGRGQELASRITKSLAESLGEEKQSELVDLILDDLLGIEPEEEDE